MTDKLVEELGLDKPIRLEKPLAYWGGRMFRKDFDKEYKLIFGDIQEPVLDIKDKGKLWNDKIQRVLDRGKKPISKTKKTPKRWRDFYPMIRPDYFSRFLDLVMVLIGGLMYFFGVIFVLFPSSFLSLRASSWVYRFEEFQGSDNEQQIVILGIFLIVFGLFIAFLYILQIYNTHRREKVNFLVLFLRNKINRSQFYSLEKNVSLYHQLTTSLFSFGATIKPHPDDRKIKLTMIDMDWNVPSIFPFSLGSLRSIIPFLFATGFVVSSFVYKLYFDATIGLIITCIFGVYIYLNIIIPVRIYHSLRDEIVTQCIFKQTIIDNKLERMRLISRKKEDQILLMQYYNKLGSIISRVNSWPYFPDPKYEDALAVFKSVFAGVSILATIFSAVQILFQ